MTSSMRVFRVLLCGFALAFFVTFVARPLTAQAQSARAGIPQRSAGAATGTAKDVTVKDAANPTLPK